MADTPRNLTDLLALLADNTTGNISAQDLRDMLVSCLGVYGSLSCFEAGAVQTDPNTGAKLTCFTTNGDAHGTTPDHTDDSIQIDVSGEYDIYFQCSFSGTASAVVKFRLRVDGVEQSFGCTRKIGTAGDIGSASFFAPAQDLTTGEKITVYIEADGATDDFTIDDCQFGCKMVG